MDSSKKGSRHSLTCDVCKIDFTSNADYALHEFSKKHCDNLIRLAKQKPVISKHKTKNDCSQLEKEPQKINLVTHTGSFSKYGYFVPGEIYANAETSKEFNIDYDPYLQKFAKSPFQVKPSLSATAETVGSGHCSIKGFSKKKRKKIKTCQVCNINLSTVPEYDTHMKSPHHIWKLKVTGMGVSAHFVKASTDLHTTDINEESKPSNSLNKETPLAPTSDVENPSTGLFPLLYCRDCELFLNSPHQYNVHLKRKSHIECAQKQAELKTKKEKLENPPLNQLYCYSCKISLNNLFQYNEHKNGKKHKTKCRNLVRKGITIPPEERVSGIPVQTLDRPVVYPELYEKLVLEKPKVNNSEIGNSTTLEDISRQDISAEMPHFYVNGHIGVSVKSSGNSTLAVNDIANIRADNVGASNENKLVMEIVENHSDSFKVPKKIFHKNSVISGAGLSNSNFSEPTPVEVHSRMETFNRQKDFLIKEEKKNPGNQITIVTDNKPVKCTICDEVFQWQSKLDAHLATEDHFKKILELKSNGIGETEILTALFSDRAVVKPNNLGKLTCSICNVVTDNKIEFDQHVSSIFHKYTVKDYKVKRTVEVKWATGINERGVYFCKSCKEEWSSLVDYNQHLHLVKHKSIQREQKAKIMLARRKSSYVQKQRLQKTLRKKNILRKLNMEKNPGVRTKVCGVAVDLLSGAQASIPNLELLEPKIDVTKNVSIGVCEKTNNTATLSNVNGRDYLEVSSVKKSFKTMRSSRKLQTNRFQSKNIPLFMSSGNVVPPLMPETSFRPRFSRPCYFPPLNNEARNSSSSSCFEPFCDRPPIVNPYFRPPCFQRPPWPGYG